MRRSGFPEPPLHDSTSSSQKRIPIQRSCSTQIQKLGAAEAVFARSVMMEEKKGKLQDLIKSTYAIIQAHYDYAHDPQKIAATYRQQLKSIVDVAYKVCTGNTAHNS